MEIQQEIVTDLEKLIEVRKGIAQTACNILEFLGKPRTKLEITEFLKLHLIDKLFDIPELPRVIVRLLPQASTYNSKLVYDAIMYRYDQDFIPGKTFATSYCLACDKILTFMSQINEEIGKLPYDDLVERNIALRRSYRRFQSLISSSLPVVIETGQFATMDVGTNSEYMTMPLEELEKQVKDCYWDLKYAAELNSWNENNPSEPTSEIRLKSILNFSIYLGSLVRY